MENVRDLIPLIIIIATLVFSAIGESKKKRKKVTKNTNLPGGVLDPEQEAFPNEMPRPVFVPLEKKSIQKIKSLSFTDEELQVQRIRKNQAPKHSSDHFRQEIIEDSLEEQKTFTLDFNDVDELKRAVIYSEILNRKEF